MYLSLPLISDAWQGREVSAHQVHCNRLLDRLVVSGTGSFYPSVMQSKSDVWEEKGKCPSQLKWHM